MKWHQFPRALQFHRYPSASRGHFSSTGTHQLHVDTSVSRLPFCFTGTLQLHVDTSASRGHFSITATLQLHGDTSASPEHISFTWTLQLHGNTSASRRHFNFTSTLQLHGDTSFYGDVLGQIFWTNEWESVRKETAVFYCVVLSVNLSESLQRTATTKFQTLYLKTTSLTEKGHCKMAKL
jgi:hypothetical protein